VIDAHGFRLNVGIILANDQGRVFWGKRAGWEDAWQFPQGGVQDNETLEETMYRELGEELGLLNTDVKIIGMTQGWLNYYLPKHLRRYRSKPLCIGQRQKWFLLQLVSADEAIRLDACESPEFDSWRWVDYWYPLQHVVAFKREVYRKALQEFAHHFVVQR
jgi:putative (di)nucleoside polyphosphate hydrolase